MIIDFNKMEYAVEPHLRGGEGDTLWKVFQDDNNKIMITKLEPGTSIGYHEHIENSETYVTLSGRGKVIYDKDKVEYVEPGMVHYCEKGHGHEAHCDGNEPWIYYAQVSNH